jgi:hypothetical protein
LRFFKIYLNIFNTQCHFSDTTTSNNLYKAKGLIELLEVCDCGSIGGFDADNPVIYDTGHRLYDRFLALVNKYGDADKIKNVCHFNLHTLGVYYNKLIKLRETFNK